MWIGDAGDADTSVVSAVWLLFQTAFYIPCQFHHSWFGHPVTPTCGMPTSKQYSQHYKQKIPPSFKCEMKKNVVKNNCNLLSHNILFTIPSNTATISLLLFDVVCTVHHPTICIWTNKMHRILVIKLYFPLNALHVSDCISPSSGATL